MSSTITIDPSELSATISGQFGTLSKELIDRANKAAEKAATETVAELKSTSPVRKTSTNSTARKKPGTYAKGWKKKKDATALGIVGYTISNTHYQLTHLLEFGHALRQGGRAAAKPHIAAAEKNAEMRFFNELYREAENL